MMRKPLLLLFIASSTIFSLPEIQPMRPALATLVETEKEFSKTSVVKGTREAFLAYLGEDSIIFRPGPVAGRKWMEEHPARPGILTWEPVFADMAKSDDLGYTTGPWEFRKQSLMEQPVAYGHYITLWRKPRFGSWKVVLDVGIQHPAPLSKDWALTWPEEQFSGGKTLRKTDVRSEEAYLLKLDQEFSKQIAKKGIERSYSEFLAEDPRLYRMEMFPMIGKSAVTNFLKEEKGVWQFLPDKAIVSGGCDLGYTYGSYKMVNTPGGSQEPGYYVRIWQKDKKGQWKLAVDVLNPEPSK